MVIVGGGAAGMMAAIFAARDGHSVTIYEKNEKLGKKLYITGKGRCNYANAGDFETLMGSLISNAKFMYGSFRGFDNHAAIAFFEELGLQGKVERGDRVFPKSDKSSDLIRALENELKRLGVKIKLKTPVDSLIIEKKEISENKGSILENESVSDMYVASNSKEETDITDKYKKKKSKKKDVQTNLCKGIVLKNGDKVFADRVIVATGGNSYQPTGSTGDGYRMAKAAGHKIIEPKPGLAPLVIKENWPMKMQGLALKNVEISVTDLPLGGIDMIRDSGSHEPKKKSYYSGFGEMLFTHFGVSGPLILAAESNIVNLLNEKPLRLTIDLKPALDEKKLDERILREIDNASHISFKNLLRKLLPETAVPVFLDLLNIDKMKRSSDLSREERKRLVYILKNLQMTIIKPRSLAEAIITKGGVDVSKVNPKNMESKLTSNLYFVGEVLDVDAITGGFNLQVAWASAHACATHLKGEK